MIPTYESKLAVDLSRWTFAVEITSPLGNPHHLTSKIPERRVLCQYARGQKMLRIRLGHATVNLPKELFQALLWEINACQAQLRKTYGRTGN